MTEVSDPAFDEIKKDNAKQKSGSKDFDDEDEKKLKEVYVQKYQGHEAILIQGMPHFLEIVDSEVILHDEIRLPDMILKPLERSMYLSKEYSFSSLAEINAFIKRAETETLDTLYLKAKQIWSQYIDANNDHLTICAADTIFTYFQDKFGMTHYLMFIGDNGTGKSNNLKVLQYLGYRALFDTSITAANIYQFLGSLEEGQGIILEDEADSIDQDANKMKIYKVGYQSGTKVTRTDLSVGRKQDSYWTYGFKAFSAERQPNNTKAKGFMERVFVLACSTGNPKHDITEIINPAGDERQTKLFEELNDLRKLLLIFRMVNYNKSIPDIELNIKNRDKQLCKPLLRLFQNSTAVNEIKATLSKLLAEKRQRKSDTLDARLFEIVVNLVGKFGLKLESKIIWDAVISNIDGNYDKYKPLSYQTEEFYEISQKKVTDTLVDKFCAIKTRTGHERTRGLLFNDKTLKKLEPNYAKAEDIEIIKNADTADGWTASIEQASAFTDTCNSANNNNNQENRDREREIHEGNGPADPTTSSNSFIHSSKNNDTSVRNPSYPSYPSALPANAELQDKIFKTFINYVTCPRCKHGDNAFHMRVHNCDERLQT